MATRKQQNHKEPNEQKITQENTSTRYSRTLHRSEVNKVVFGVAGGLGEYFDIDPTLIRVIFIALTVFGGSGILLYLILCLVMPSASSSGPITEETIRENASNLKDTAEKFAQDIRKDNNRENSRFWLGAIVAILGFLFLFGNYGLFNILDMGRLWPLILVVLGLLILFRK